MSSIGYIQGPALLASINTRLEALTFPASTEYSGTPAVRFMGTYNETSYEEIELVGKVEDGDIDWYDTGARTVEQLTVEIVIRSNVPGVTGPAAITRADALFQVVQAGFRDMTTGKPTGLTDAKLIANYRIAGYDLDTVPLPDGGWGATITCQLRLRTHQ